MKYVFCLFVFLSSLSLHAQGWNKKYTYSAGAAVEDYDKGFLIGDQNSDSPYNGVLIKTDINGKVLWQKYTDSLVSINSVLSKKDGSIIFGGRILNNDTTGYAYITKLDACGDTVWTTLFSYSSNIVSFVSNLGETSTGDILALCENYGDQPCILFCLDNNGKLKWKYGDGIEIYGILSNPNGEILLSSTIYIHDDNLPADITAAHSIVTLIDSSGKKLWSDIYGHTSPYKYGIGGVGFRSPDKGYLSVCYNGDDNKLAEGDNYIIKYDSLGNRKWVHYFGDKTTIESFNEGAVINDTTFILVGNAYDTLFLQNGRLRILKITAAGVVLGSEDFFLGPYGNGYTIRRTSDGKFIVCSDAGTNGQRYTSVIKIDENLNVDSFYTHSTFSYDYLCTHKVNNDSIHFPHNYNIINVDTMTFASAIETVNHPSPLQLKIYPNPFTNSTNISYTLNAYSSVKIEVYDLMGRRVSTIVDQAQGEGEHTVQFNADQYIPTGMYLVRVNIGNTVVTKQMMVLR